MNRPHIRHVTLAVIQLIVLVLVRGAHAGPAAPQSLAFATCFGGTVAKVEASRTVVTRTIAGPDAGCDIGERLPLDAAHARVTVQPAAQVNGGVFNVTILLFDEAGGFITEKPWISDTNSLEPHAVDVRRWVRAQNVQGAARYLLRVRVQPHDKAGAGFAFTGVTVAPASPRKER